MNRTAKLAGQMVLVAALAFVALWWNARIVPYQAQPGMVSVPELTLVEYPKPPGACC
jgi:hypothetical protein